MFTCLPRLPITPKPSQALGAQHTQVGRDGRCGRPAGPRPLLAESARQDECFPWPYAQPTLARLRQVYRVAGAENDLTICIYDGDHRYYGDGVVEFLGALPMRPYRR